MPQKLSIEKIIIRFKKVHNNKYEYLPVLLYKNNSQKIDIKCPEHGIFQQSVKHHLNGSGCPACSSVHKYSTDEFIKLSKLKHGSKYSYNKST